ncbi:ABC transporter ATP-binding protein [Bosea sp. TWI1241]|uniref:ABC transporter ATP-binding protein n=1 Tax=Bosea sp. TWI1241 TaxID=3148904 RepID=UPI003209D7E8
MQAYLRPYRLRLALSAALAIAGAAFGLVPFYAVYAVTLALMPGGTFDPDTLWLWTGIAFAAILGKTLAQSLAAHLSHLAAYDLLLDLRMALVAKLDRVPLGFFAGRSTGELHRVIVDDVQEIEDAIAHAVPDTAAAFAVPLLSAGLLASIDWRLALAAMAMFPVLLALFPLTLVATKPHRHAFFGAMARLKGLTIQYVQGMKVIRAFLGAEHVHAELERAIDDMATVGLRYAGASLTPMALLTAGLRANVLVLLPVAGLLNLSGQADAGTVVLFLLLGMGINVPVFRIIMVAGTIFWRMQTAGRAILAVLDAPELPEATALRLPERFDLAFRDVRFAYDGKTVLDGVSFTAAQGSLTAIVGASGAGKSTIARLAARFWDPDGGGIEIGGVDLRDLQADVRVRTVGFLLQDAWLFNDTIRANIHAGRPDASDAEVDEAARRACVSEFAVEFPLGLDTPVGEGGRALSGGQRQRVAIAREILKAAPVILLDEATAALDTENEAAVLKALRELGQGRTVIAIAHRLDTVRNADRILLVEDGRIAAQGDHDTLLTGSNSYRTLWQRYEANAGWRLPPGGGGNVAVPQDEPPQPAPGPAGCASAGIPLAGGAGLRLLWQLAGPAGQALLRRAVPLLALESLLFGAPVIATFLALSDIFAGMLTRERIVAYTLALLICFILQALAAVFSQRILWRVQTSAVADLQRRLVRHLRAVPLGLLLARDTGEAEAAVTRHAAELNFVMPPGQAMRIFVAPLLSLAVMLLLDWRLALAAVATLPLFAVLVSWMDRAHRTVWERLVAARERLGGRVIDYLQGIGTLRALGLGAGRFTALQQALEEHHKTTRDTIVRLTPSIVMSWSALDVGFCVILLTGGLLTQSGTLAPAILLLFLVVGLVFYAPIADAFEFLAFRRLHAQRMQRIATLLDLPVQHEPATPLRPASLDLRFEGVSFAYGDRPALKEVDLDLPAGQLHAFVGASGSGKSSALALIARFFDPDAGRISLGGVDLREISETLRSKLFAIVLQDTFLFDDTVAANLKLGRPEASLEEMVAAARAAGCHDFVMALEKGYDTPIGEGGQRLSGGERQRLSIARAILKDAPIVLLDEATASIDPDTEYDIRQAIEAVCRGKTVIVVSHRLQSVKAADQIIAFRSGRALLRPDSC